MSKLKLRSNALWAVPPRWWEPNRNITAAGLYHTHFVIPLEAVVQVMSCWVDKAGRVVLSGRNNEESEEALLSVSFVERTF